MVGEVTRFEFGSAFTRTFSTLFSRFLVFLLLAVVFWGPYSVIAYVVESATGLDAAFYEESVDPTGGQVAALFLIAVLALVAYLLFFGAVVDAAIRHLRGLDVSVRDAFVTTATHIGPLLLVWLIMWGVSIAIALLIAVLFQFGGVVGAIGLLAGVLFYVYLCLRWLVALPAILVEDLGPVAGLSRSSVLTKGRRWRILGLLIVISMLVSAAAVVISIVVGVPFALIGLGAAGEILGQIIGAVCGAVLVIAVAVVYHDLRIEKDGPDAGQAAAVFD